MRIGDLCRSSDDGEPGGTAGRLILQAMDGQTLDRVALVVSRWFGGVLPGACLRWHRSGVSSCR
ncbi:YigZ family protein [Azospirillum brasilense]|uniref:YigZ family protein n=1 Tax=Azospirillum brasilense TaxID=192 RepID=UPI0032B7B638